MARSAAVPVDGVTEQLSADEQAAMDADRAAENEEIASAAVQPGDELLAGTPDGAVGAGDGGDPAVGADMPAADGQAPRQGMVPHAALHEERTKRQESERQLAEERKRSATLEERTNIILQRFAAPQQQAAPTQTPTLPEIPAFETDPAGHILAKQHQNEAILGELVQAVVGLNRQTEQANGVQQLTQRAAAMERQYAATNPDYDKASAYLYDARRKDLVAVGFTDPAEIEQMMAHEATGLVTRAAQQGRNPAELVYALAKIRGYAPAPPATEDPATATPATNTSTSNGAVDQLRTIAAGQQQARTVGNLPGSGPVPVTAARLADMTAEEFAEFQKTKPQAFRDLMGA